MAAKTLNGFATVALASKLVNSKTKPVIILSLLTLWLTNGSYHIGLNSRRSPVVMIIKVTNASNPELL